MTPQTDSQLIHEKISSSKDFIAWLAQEHISLALSTYQTSRLFLIGTTPEGRPSCFKRLFDHAMGIFPTPNRLLMGTQNEIWQFENLLAPVEKCQGYDHLYVPQHVYQFGDLDIHDLVEDSQGQIIFANTKYNCLATPNPEAPNGFECIWRPPFISSLAPEDRCHLNGLALLEGQPRYVTSVSRSDVIDGWRQKRDSSGIVMDISSNEVLATGLSMPHSPRFYQGKLWLLNSGKGEFGYVDLDNGKFEPVAFCPGYGRGLAFWKNFAIIGLSRPRDQTFAGLSLDQRLGEKEAEPRCGLVVIDLNSGHIVHWMWIEGVIQELYDVQILPNVQQPAVVKQFATDNQDPRLLLNAKSTPIVQSTWEHPPENLSRSKVLTVASEPKRVIAFSLWGDNPKYTIGAIKNAELAPHFYPHWICRYYVNQTVPDSIIEQLQVFPHVEVIYLDNHYRDCRCSLWRFLAILDPAIAVVILRDADSRLNAREQAAVDSWLASDQPVHIMRDHPLHRLPIMAGMWGVQGQIPQLRSLLSQYLNHPDCEFTYGVDQRFLADVIYPRFKNQSLVHDEFFDHQPFPVPRQDAEYVGQIFNANDQSLARFDKMLKAHLRSPSKEETDSARQYFIAGKSAQDADNFEEAEGAYQSAIAIDPTFAAAHHHLGLLWVKQEQFTEAKQQFEQVLTLNPNSVAAHSNLAQILVQENHTETAIAHFQTALKLNRNYVPALYNFGLLYRRLYRLDQAVVLFRRVVAIDSHYHEAILQLGQILDYRGKFDEALVLYEKALTLNPDHSAIAQRLGMLKIRLCDWRAYDDYIAMMRSAMGEYIADGDSGLAVGAYDLNLLPLPLDLMAKTLQRYGQSIVDMAPTATRGAAPATADKLRIGYASPDFADHAVGRLIDRLFGHHNRDQFEVYGYHLRPAEADDPYTKSIAHSCDVFRNLSALPVREAAQTIQDDGIHILVNLAGYTAFGRPELFAMQPAPIQVQWLGFPNTMGAEFIQYVLADRWLVPAGSHPYYQESVIELPQAFIGSLANLAETPSRAQQHLPETGFVFGCFNTHHKIEPEVFATWMRILKQVSNSVLWLAAPRVEAIASNLHLAAQDHGVDPERLIFAQRVGNEEHLARLQLIDLALDTFVYSAGSTAITYINAGVPLLTKAGATNASRMGASICATAGLEDLICDGEDIYEQRAVSLAQHPEQLQEVRDRLKHQRAQLPLFDSPAFAGQLEKVYQQLWADQ